MATTSRVRGAVAVGVLGVVLAGCGGDGDSADEPAATEEPTSTATAAGEDATRDFDARLNGPATADPTEVVVLTLTNTGRNEDTYGVTVEPDGAGAVDTRNLTLRSSRSAKVRIEVTETPLIVKVESVGAGGYVDAFIIR